MRRIKIDKANSKKFQWQIRTSKTLVKNKYVDLREHQVVRSDKTTGVHYILYRKDYVCVVPFDGKHFWLVGQYRITAKAYAWEFVQGGIDDKDSSLSAAAKRELREETGFTAGKWSRLGAFHLAQGIMDQRGHIFLAEDLIKVTDSIGEEEGEILQLKKVTPKKLEKMVKNGEIWDASSLLCYYFYKDHVDNIKN